MSWTWIPIFSLLGMLIIGVPVGMSLLMSAIPYFLLYATTIPGSVIIQQMVSNTESSSMMAIPFFITAGVIMNYSGVTRQLMALADVLVGHMQGGLAQVNILLSTMTGGMSGSAAADCAMECKILVPEMERRGYDREFCAAVTAASSLITPMIPPGIGLLVYAFCCNVSIGKMFTAGIIPGLIICVCFMIYVTYASKKHNYPPSRESRAGWSEIRPVLRKSLFALGLPVLLIVGLRMGVFTATEGGAMCALYSAIAGLFVYREMKLKDFFPILKESVLATAAVMMVMCATKAFSYYLTWEGIPQMFSALLVNMNVNKVLFLLIINVVFLFLGMFIEGSSLVMIMAPLLLPAVNALGLDLVHFGIIMVMNMTIGALTPPFGTILYVVSPMLEMRVVTVAKALMPFIAILIGLLLLFTYVPGIVTFLPNLLYR